MKTAYITTLAFTFFLLFACSKDSGTTGNTTPPPGSNANFGAKINGTSFPGTSGINVASASYNESAGGASLGLSFVSQSSNFAVAKTIGIGCTRFGANGIENGDVFTGEEPGTPGNLFYAIGTYIEIHSLTTPVVHAASDSISYVEITNIDKTKKEVSGNFNFIARDTINLTYSITSGWFTDVEYN